MRKLVVIVLMTLTIGVNGQNQNAIPKLKLVSAGANLPVDIYQLVGLDNGSFTTFAEIFGAISEDYNQISMDEKSIHAFFENEAVYHWLVQNKAKKSSPFLFLDKNEIGYIVRSFYSADKEFTMLTKFISPLSGLQVWKADKQPFIITKKVKR